MTDTATVDLPQETSTGDVTHVDVLIVGAGVSGIGAAHHLRDKYPDRSFAILDAQDAFGGTWWAHRFPGIRSDSDLFTYGYQHKPWRGPSIATADQILKYLEEVIEEEDLAGHIHYSHRVTALEWSSQDSQWTAHVTRGDTGEQVRYTANFLWMCQGYYNFDEPYTPNWPGMDRYEGTLVHPEQWQEDVDYADKRVLIIGSGATMATVAPEMAKTAEHVTVLQRSPSFYAARPVVHDLAKMLEPLDLPPAWTHEILRRQYIMESDAITTLAQTNPDEAREMLLDGIRDLLPEGADIDKDFTPKYRPWQQRIVRVPDGDFFERMRAGKISVVTDTINEFVEKGVQISSGEVLEADIIVTATGFNMSTFGDIPFEVDGEPVDFTKRVTWRGLMISGVPNMTYAFGYFRHSWTLRIDMINELVGRIFGHMVERNAHVVVPTLRPEDEDMPLMPWVDSENISAGYMMRSLDKLYKQGDRDPWKHLYEYDHEAKIFPEIDVEDGLEYR
ncbi:cation diffusion facilitator CzcD-associated flavoprotein CzcO [Antricoccus suffuscus]|uniref:Cation diffusion facilitator CzcD-associated flavoprotein CzcO n=1 Tax=Antricoccus suffuscus TaxID=1629062 RepID=A0A2T1A6N0_9ACTN|nr:NAD(P)/FAD-dependent oxidoreductase [Antricoccus suffuscus]PRZ44251.1 cation diffusion facilitator CzcD-associated flavoprotein CzcO [Antricoccus suffuscus]